MAAVDNYGAGVAGITGPGDDAYAITTSDSTDLPYTSRAIYCGSTGDIVLITKGGSTVTFKSVPTGAIIPIRATRVKATNTTASQLVALI